MKRTRLNDEEKRRNRIYGSFMFACFLAYVAVLGHMIEPQWPLKSIAAGVGALILVMVGIYNILKKPSDSQAFRSQVAEIDQKTTASRWQATLAALVCCAIAVPTLVAHPHRPQEAAVFGLGTLIFGIRAAYAWWLRHRRRL